MAEDLFTLLAFEVAPVETGAAPLILGAAINVGAADRTAVEDSVDLLAFAAWDSIVACAGDVHLSQGAMS
jgi:hypothetical protein